MEIMKSKQIQTLIKCAVTTRIGLFLLQILVSVLPDHQHSMDDVFMSDKRYPPHPFLVETLLGGYDNWDSEYFLFIAEHGYTYEQFLAFFPLYPLLMRFIASTFLTPLQLFLPMRSVLLISGILITSSMFVLATIFLFQLTQKLTRNTSLAIVASILFCINPASVFMSSIYTESLFAFLSFAGMLAIAESKPIIATISFSLATATRSNGIVATGFLVYFHLREVLFHIRNTKTLCLKFSVQHLLLMAVHILIIVSPFVFFQVYGYYKFCVETKNSSLSTFCNSSVPMPYSYVQRKYWDVGFLRYYQLKQIPNFLLASPMIFLVLFCLKKYFITDRVSITNGIKRLFKTGEDCISESKIKITGIHGNMSVFPHMIQVAFLLVFGVTSMHIQIITRFICSSSPVIYWFVSETIIDFLSHKQDTLILRSSSFKELIVEFLKLIPHDTREFRRIHLAQILFVYFVIYIVLGFIMHCNFLPWT